MVPSGHARVSRRIFYTGRASRLITTYAVAPSSVFSVLTPKFFTVAYATGQVKEIAVQCRVYEATLPDFFIAKYIRLFLKEGEEKRTNGSDSAEL